MLFVLFWFWLGTVPQFTELTNENYLQPVDSILIWLDRIHSFQAELAKADLYMHLGQQTQALACLNGISAKVNLTEEQAIDLAEIIDVWTTVLSITPENRPQKLAALEQIANTKPISFASAYARNTLEMEGQHFTPLVPEWEDEVAERAATFEKLEYVTSVKFYPNPTSNWLQYELNQPTSSDEWFIEGINAVGNAVLRVRLPKGQQAGIIELGQLSSGFYIFRLLNGDQILASQPLSLQK